MMVIVKCYPRLEGNMGENVFKDRRLCWRRSDNEFLCFFSYTANTDRTSCNSGGSTEVIAVMYGVYVAVLLREQATACGLPCQLSSWTNAQVCLLSFACETKTRWECSSQTVSCARQRVVIAIERFCAFKFIICFSLPSCCRRLVELKHVAPKFSSVSLEKVLAKLQKGKRCQMCALSPVSLKLNPSLCFCLEVVGFFLFLFLHRQACTFPRRITIIIVIIRKEFKCSWKNDAATVYPSPALKLLTLLYQRKYLSTVL